jgi:hypothetical protein
VPSLLLGRTTATEYGAYAAIAASDDQQVGVGGGFKPDRYRLADDRGSSHPDLRGARARLADGGIEYRRDVFAAVRTNSRAGGETSAREPQLVGDYDVQVDTAQLGLDGCPANSGGTARRSVDAEDDRGCCHGNLIHGQPDGR